jgi:Protein of unknown function (DUF1573)
MTDIPPGEEGKIEVIFDSSKKKGLLSKNITVESNDPANPKASLKISAFIEVEFGFETYSLKMDQIRKGESKSKTAVLILKDSSKRNLLELNTQSSNIFVKIVESASGDEGRIDVEVTVKPGTPPGKLNETVTAGLSDASFPLSSLRIFGTIVGNVKVSPETVRFKTDTSLTVADQLEQKVRVVTTQNNVRFQLLGVKDPNERLAFEIDTLTTGKQYVIRAKPNENAMKLERMASGEIKIMTDDPDQPEIGVRYNITPGR